MGTVTALDTYRPHVTIQVPGGTAYSIPLQVLIDFVEGDLPLQQIEGGEVIARAFVANFLQGYMDFPDTDDD